MSSKQHIGLDIGSSAVRLVVVDHGGRDSTLERVAYVPLDPGAVVDGLIQRPDEVATAVLQASQKAKVKKGSPVAISLMNSDVLIRQVDLPWMAPSEFRNSLNYLAKDHLPSGSAEEMNLDYYALNETNVPAVDPDAESRVRILLVGAKRDMVSDFADVVEAAGLRPTRFDVTPFSLLRVLVKTFDRNAAPEVVVHIGGDLVTIIVHRGGVPTFVRTIPGHGSNRINEALMSRFEGIDWAQAEEAKIKMGLGSMSMVGGGAAADGYFGAGGGAQQASRAEHPSIPVIQQQVSGLISEIRTSLDFLSTQQDGQSLALNRIQLMGGGSRLHGLQQRIAAELGMQVVLENPIYTMKGRGRDDLDDVADPDFSPVLGSAMGV